jgi:hypothetical protein
MPNMLLHLSFDAIVQVLITGAVVGIIKLSSSNMCMLVVIIVD